MAYKLTIYRIYMSDKSGKEISGITEKLIAAISGYGEPKRIIENEYVEKTKKKLYPLTKNLPAAYDWIIEKT